MLEPPPTAKGRIRIDEPEPGYCAVASGEYDPTGRWYGWRAPGSHQADGREDGAEEDRAPAGRVWTSSADASTRNAPGDTNAGERGGKHDAAAGTREAAGERRRGRERGGQTCEAAEVRARATSWTPLVGSGGSRGVRGGPEGLRGPGRPWTPQPRGPEGSWTPLRGPGGPRGVQPGTGSKGSSLDPSWTPLDPNGGVRPGPPPDPPDPQGSSLDPP